MITVFFETKTGSYVEEVASIKDEELYMLCLPILKKEAEKQNMIVTESVDEVLANKKQEVKEERVMLADENKNMAKFLETLGYKKNDIDCICVGDYEGVER